MTPIHQYVSSYQHIVRYNVTLLGKRCFYIVIKCPRRITIHGNRAKNPKTNEGKNRRCAARIWSRVAEIWQKNCRSFLCRSVLVEQVLLWLFSNFFVFHDKNILKMYNLLKSLYTSLL